MAKKKVPSKRSHQAAVGPVAPLIVLSLASLRGELARYQQWRKSWALGERLAELLWSPEGMRIDLREANEKAGLYRKINQQKQFGDGYLKDRATLQKDALQTCKARVYDPLRRAKSKAAQSSRDHTAKLGALKGQCDRAWDLFQEKICEIGERFRDEYWLALHSRECRCQIRDDDLVRVQAHALLPAALAGHYRFVRDHLGPVCEPEAQEYVAALARVVELWPRVKPSLDFSGLLPEDANYRGKDGRPWAPVQPCTNALKKLKPAIPATAVNQFLMAWCIKPYSA